MVIVSHERWCGDWLSEDRSCSRCHEAGADIAQRTDIVVLDPTFEEALGIVEGFSRAGVQISCVIGVSSTAGCEMLTFGKSLYGIVRSGNC
jgi:hypothetical protein